MAPSWIPLCRSMQLYCEPFFASINNWRAYENEVLIHNRLELIETACQIFHVYSQNPELHKFELVCENEVPLLEEVQPTAGRDYKVGGDQIAFKTAMTTQPKVLFHKAGVFFQDNLLKGIAGWTPEVLAGANIETRATIIAAVEKLFRIPEEAGIARFMVTHHPNTSSYVKLQQKTYPTVVLGQKGDIFYRYIEASRKPGFDFDADDTKAARPEAAMVVPVQAAKKKRARAAEEKEDEWEEDADGVVWTRKHHSVGSKVAAHFPPLEPQTHLVAAHDDPVIHIPASTTTSKLFRGKVTKYAPPSAPGLTDQLYHIRWEDGDEQDYDEMDIQRGMDLYDSIDGWTTRHPTVGMRVAAYFPVPGKGNAIEQVLFCGSITKYGKALSEDDVTLYHVVFDDGDEQDFSEHELQMGIELFNSEGVTKSAATGKNASKGAAAAAVSSPPSAAKSVAKKAKVEKEIKEVKKEIVSPSSRNASKKDLHPDLSKASKAKAVAKPTKAATALFGESKAKALAAAAAAKKNTAPAAAKKSTRNAAASSSSSASKDTASTLELLEEVGEEEGEDDPVWIMNHPSVFKRVAQSFLVPGPKGKTVWEDYGGTVAVYAAPTAPGLRDQLYHIVWDDGDEQDYDEPDLQAGLGKMEAMMPTPLYVPSKQAKALVAARQRSLATDYDYSSLSSAGASGASGAGARVKMEAATPVKNGASSSSSGSGKTAEVIDLEPSPTNTATTAATVTTSATTSTSGALKQEVRPEVTDFTQVDDGAGDSEGEGGEAEVEEDGEREGAAENDGGVYDSTQVEGDGEDEEMEEDGEDVITTTSHNTISPSNHAHHGETDLEARADSVDPTEMADSLNHTAHNTINTVTTNTATPADVNEIGSGAQNAYNEHSTVEDLFKNATHSSSNNSGGVSGESSSSHSGSIGCFDSTSTTSSEMVVDTEVVVISSDE